MKCIKCKNSDVVYQKWRLCHKCYHKQYRANHKTRINKGGDDLCVPTMQKHETVSEIEFIKNYFSHGNWLFEPTVFRLNGCSYTPDFYDAERNCFIEVVGTRQAYHFNKTKYDLFRKTFPAIKFEIRHKDGSLLDETTDRLTWMDATARNELSIVQ